MAEIDRALTDRERSLLLALATRNVADEAGCSHDEATDVLARLTAEGHLVIEENAEDAYVLASGHVRVKTARDWLAFHAEFPGHDPMKNERRG
jgi:hypothetical protein